MKPPLLIIFYRNPELGKVKSRLAVTMGESKALAVYLLLSAHVREVTTSLRTDKVVYYSNYIDSEDGWSNDVYLKRLQIGEGLGNRMKAAFKESFDSGYREVIIIGTDCLELTYEILNVAFKELRTHDVVIGPAKDGGYYLLGMKRFHPVFFENKNWSTDSVFTDTINDTKRLNLTYHVLPVISDVDEETDLPPGFFTT
jgi:rSAM/selenodomain-associated transferase 1